MKKLLLFFTTLLLISCSSDDEDCDCGIIESQNLDCDGVCDRFLYYADIRNECTNEIENDVQITENIYVNKFVGDRFCNISKNRLN